MVRCKGTRRGRIAMCSACNGTQSFNCDAAGDGPASPAPSRRALLSSGAAAVAGAAAAQALPRQAVAQGAAQAAPDAELARVQGARRVLLKGGVVLTLDRQVGDFAAADVLVEEGKIREV